jgi:hypothetical protein
VCQQSNDYLRQRSSAKATGTVNSARLRAQKSEQRQKPHRAVNSDCPVHHRTVRWPHLSELQRSNPNGWVTWLAHRTVSGGAPDCPVRHTTTAIPNDHFGGWGYKYPQPPILQGIQVFSCNALNLGVEFFLLVSHQIQALPFSFLVPSLNLDLFQSYSEVWLGFPV